jgi:hypothetical protein
MSDEEKKPPYQHRKQPPQYSFSTEEEEQDKQQQKQQQQQNLKNPPPSSQLALSAHQSITTPKAANKTTDSTMMNQLPFAFENEPPSSLSFPHPYESSLRAELSSPPAVPVSASAAACYSRSGSIASTDGSISMASSSQTAATTDEKSDSQQQQLDGVSSTDVLCGRDKLSHGHVGNKQFRRLIEKHRAAYQSAPSREAKTQITCKVIASIHGYGGRFLKLDDSSGTWDEVSDLYAREKVSHALRSAKDPYRPRIKKRRQMKEYVPTPEEESLFQDALADQQQIFQSMIAKYQQQVHLDNSNQNDGDDGDDNDDAGYDNEDPFDFDFYN